MGNSIKKTLCCKYGIEKEGEIQDKAIITSKRTLYLVKKLQSVYRGFIIKKKFKYYRNYGLLNNLGKVSYRKPGIEVDESHKPENPKQAKLDQLDNLIPSFHLNEKEQYMLENSNLIKSSIIYPDKSLYKGYYNQKWQRHGYGIFYLIDGSVYEGFFKNDKMDGRGRLLNIEGFVYEGEFTNNKANGYGKYVSLEGIMYKGSWKDEKQNGKGEEVYPDGSTYEGNFVNGKKNGNGKFSWADGSEYEGEFYNNEIHGYGTYRWKDKRVFRGNWNHNKMNGNGIFVWPDKKKYIGAYKDDNKHGYGVFLWPDGRKYEGTWVDGKQHGYGILTQPGEVKKYCEFEKGKKIRTLSPENVNEIETIKKELNTLVVEANFNQIENNFILRDYYEL